MTLEEFGLVVIGAQVSTLLVLALRTQTRLGRIGARIEEHDRRLDALERDRYNVNGASSGAGSPSLG